MLLAMFLATGLLPPTFAFMAGENSIVQAVPNAQELFEQGEKLYRWHFYKI
jgi:hypothetical protein